MKFVKIENGVFAPEGAHKPVRGVVFPLLQDLRHGKYGPWVKVDARNVPGFPSRNIRIYVKGPEDFKYVEEHQLKDSKSFKKKDPRTDEEIIADQELMFRDLAELVDSARQGTVRSMIVSGDAGLGKSYTVEETLNESFMLDEIAGRRPSYEILKGDISPVHLFAKLFEHHEAGHILVLDDCDEILFDASALNMLKAALDTSPRRWISYNKESRFLADKGVPNKFMFKGSVIFITNVDFERQIERGNKNSPHYSALISRSHYVDVQLRSKREKWLRMQYVSKAIFDDMSLNETEQFEVMNFIEKNFDNLREMSLRTMIKVAQLRGSSSDRWKALATTSVIRDRNRVRL